MEERAGKPTSPASRNHSVREKDGLPQFTSIPSAAPPANRGREGRPALTQGHAASRARGRAPRSAGACARGRGLGRGAGPAQEPGRGARPTGWGCRLPSVRQRSTRPQPGRSAAAAAARGNLGPALGAGEGGRQGDRSGAAGTSPQRPGRQGMPSGSAAWGGAAGPATRAAAPG